MFRLLSGVLGVLAVVAGVQDGSRVFDRIAAVVDGEVITLSEITSRLANRGGPLPEHPAEREDRLREALQELIDRRLIARAAFQSPFFEITEAEVDAYLQRRRLIQGEERLAALQRASGLSALELRRLAREELAVTRFIALRFAPFVIVLPDEVERRYEERYGRFGEFAPARSATEDDLRQGLAQEKIEEQVQRWVRSERRKSDIRVLLFEDPRKGNRP